MCSSDLYLGRNQFQLTFDRLPRFVPLVRSLVRDAETCSSMTVALVTGANGFLGSALVRMLTERGYKVRALVRKRVESLADDRCDFFMGDLRNVDSVLPAARGVDVIFHVAGVSGIWGSWKHFHSSNTIATRNVLAAAQQAKVPKLVYTSSPSVTFDGGHQINVDETTSYPKHWLCHYQIGRAHV